MRKFSGFLFFVVLFLNCTTPLLGQTSKGLLTIADSLFAEKKYTQSFEVYEQILENEKMVSPQMLLKMAFIKEALDDNSKALYYLNLYYLKTSDKKVLEKMESMAEEYNLAGYEYTDFEFFQMNYRKYSAVITYVLIFVCLLLVGFIVRQKFMLKEKPLTLGITLTCVAALLFFHVNFSDTYSKGIVIQEQSYLMEAPSSGADLVAILEKGHRVEIKNRFDVWVEIIWEGKIAYIRESNIVPIQ